MYLLFALLLPILLILLLICHQRKKKNLQKVYAMDMNHKCKIINELLAPFGYAYIPSQDLFTSRTDAWQREFGYHALYDKAAAHFNMVFDCIPIYFNYQGRTWLLEVWKGQYGINTGAEIGLYQADRILKTEERETTLFQAVNNADMMKLSLALYKDDTLIAQLSGRHWWLTAFRLGCFSQPNALCLRASITFSSPEMARVFVEGLVEAGYSKQDICRRCNTVTFLFDHTPKIKGFLRRLHIRLTMWGNQFWCRIYLFITRPFHLSIDRVLYLYYYLPFAFRRTLRIRRYKK